jgi:bifunctional non-homologous end joining protein LigD
VPTRRTLRKTDPPPPKVPAKRDHTATPGSGDASAERREVTTRRMNPPETLRERTTRRMDPREAPREAMPEHLAPMLATAAALPREQDGWAFELKWDGVRALAYLTPGRAHIESRSRNAIDSRYPELRALGRQLGKHEALLDGEIVAFDEHGAPSFERLARRMHQTSEHAIRRLAEQVPVTYVIFDLLHLDGRSTMELPYAERRALLEELALGGPAWQTPANHTAGHARALLRATAARGLEGLVAKRLDSPYRPGERSRAWLKIKNVARQEFVIGGWLPGKGNREGKIGSLLVGYYEHAGASRAPLRYAGRVGTGFDEAELRRLQHELDARARRTSPFAKLGVQPPREARHVKPELVAEVQFSHWTRDAILRHSVYRGLRDDKPARAVLREDPHEEPRAAVAGDEPIVHETTRHTEIVVAGRTLRLSNRDKLLYPHSGFTKGQLIDYYAAIAPVLLPHLAGHPLTLKRYPDGVDSEFFYEKRCPTHRPAWVRTAPIPSERGGGPIDYCLVEDLPTLVWLANLAAIELHPSLARAAAIDTPTALVFDLDPGAGAGLRECCRVALHLRELFDALGLHSFVKTSGVKGLQLYVPLNNPVTYADTKPFARAVARLLERHHPRLVTSRMTKSVRAGRVLIDWSQNDPHKTTVSVYSLRATAQPLVSTPLHWEEVEHAARARREPQLSLQPAALLARVQRDGDLHAPLYSLVQRLPEFADTPANPCADRGA